MKCLILWITIVFAFCRKDSLSLKNVTLTLEPSIVERHHTCILRCTYDLEETPLYTVKWYRGLHEFYRYTPNEYPNTKIFAIGGITVDVKQSNSTQAVITNVQFNLSGNFSCEVTTEEGFSTGVDMKTLLVVQLPEDPPTISVINEPLDYGDILKANCSSPPSKPPAALKFILNEKPVSEVDTLVPIRYQELLWSDLTLELQLLEYHFKEGRLILRCEAQVADVYHEYAEIQLSSARDPVPERVSAVDRANNGAALASIRPIVVLIVSIVLNR